VNAWYNENDPKKAAWLRELMKANVIAPGEVDERSITEVRAGDLRGFRQCHFFAGIGVWSYALRWLVGWPDDRPVWTGSCPCPSFSCAGKGRGFDDPRHLWPHWSRLIRKCRPARIFGEQVAAAIGHGWLDLVYVDLEAAAYAVGSAVLGACCVGAPHIRQRLYFGAHQLREEYGTTIECLQPHESGLFARRETGETLGYRDSTDAAS
jgi:DNA (cytosine-5)-methyltransferase 1